MYASYLAVVSSILGANRYNQTQGKSKSDVKIKMNEENWYELSTLAWTEEWGKATSWIFRCMDMSL